MRLLVSWLRDFVEVPVSPEDLAAMLSMRGFEVAGIEAAPTGPVRPDPASGARPGLPALGPDAVIDLEITANRPDCLGVMALAREVATAYDVPLKRLDHVFPAGDLPDGSAGRASGAQGTHPDLRVTIEAVELCPRYAASVADITPAPSPAWLANRLEAAGIRPISNVVDITNYVLVETGHPMHAFDLSRLAGREIRIRCARPGERITTLDGVERALAPDMLVIADASAPQAIAGVMGGAGSEVWSGTRVVAFESAYFKPTSVRQTSKRTGLKTEASSRFERGADISAPPIALARAIALIAATGAGRPRGRRLDCYPSPRSTATVGLRRGRIAHLLGMRVEDTDVVRILEGLGFCPEATPDGWRATVPTARVDVTREEDLVEEVARHAGYDRLPATLPSLDQLPPAEPAALTRTRMLCRLLVGAGFFEAQTYAFIEARAAAPYAGDGPQVTIAHPLSEKFAVLRPSLAASLVDAVATNRNRGRRDVRLFEIGAVFAPDAGEAHHLGLIWTGAAVAEHWSGGAREVDFFDLKGAIERVCQAVEVPIAFKPVDTPDLVRGRAAAVFAGTTRIGTIGQMAPVIAEARGLPAADVIYVAELDLDALGRLAPAGDVRSRPLARFPQVMRDVAVLVRDGVPAAALCETIRAAAPESLVGVGEFDRYTGAGIPDGHVSLAFHLVFRAPDRTLVDAEIQQAMETIVSALVQEHGAVQR